MIKTLKYRLKILLKKIRNLLNSSDQLSKLMILQDRTMSSVKTIINSSNQINNLLVLQGRTLALQNVDRAPFSSIKEAEFKVFSQSGEDGILQYIVQESGIEDDEKTFVEFGVEDYSEANTRFLLVNNFWRGLIIDGDKTNMNKVRNSDLYWKSNLTAIDAWVDKESINQLIGDSGFSGKIGILSIDIDGNDYWVWESISVVDPVIVVVEWNSVFGPKHAVTTPYSAEFNRAKAHYSCLYWGASMRAFEILGERKGYQLVGSNALGNNIFFIKKERIGRVAPVTTKDAYVESQFRDSRNEHGELNFLGGYQRYREICELPLVDVTSNTITTLKTLDQ